ncbi:MAG: RNA polymerase sigma factor [Rhodanobacteraceae bacterium]
MTDRRHQQRFEALLGEHRRIVFKVAAIYAGSVEDRNDLAQEICTQLWRSFAHYDEARGRFSTWMYRIALNVAISHARSEPSAQALRLEPLQTHHLETIGDDDLSEQTSERLEALYALIDGLDALNRALILLYLEDRSYAEIADILGVSETNVATKISRIKHKLRGQATAAQTIGA